MRRRARGTRRSLPPRVDESRVLVSNKAPRRESALGRTRRACRLAVDRLKELMVGVEALKDADAKRAMLEKCAGTALNSKLVSGHKDFFAPMVVDAISALDCKCRRSLILCTTITR